MTTPLIALTSAVLDLAPLVARAADEQVARGQAGEGAGAEGAGAIVTFVGTVRGRSHGRLVERLDYQAYEPLALRAFERIAAELASQWPEVVLVLHHRLGTLQVGEASIAIVAAAPHRADAFAASRYAIERVKQIAPIWKREVFADGACWVEGAVADPDDRTAREEALRRACA